MENHKDLLDKYSQEYKIDSQTKQKSEELFVEYLSKKQNIQQCSDNFYHLAMRTAILVASKTTLFQTIDKVFVRGAGLSVTQFLRGSPQINIDEFIHSLKDFTSIVKLDQSVITDCNYISREFAYSQAIYTKFDDIWNKLGIKDRSLSKDCAEKLKKISWLIFIIAKVRILQRRGDIIEFAYLLVATIFVVLTHSSNEIQCEFFDNFLNDTNTEESKKNLEGVSSHLLQFLQVYIKASHQDPINISKDSLLDLLHKLKEREMIKGFDNDSLHLEFPHIERAGDCTKIQSQCLHGVFNSENLNSNYRKLDQYYAQKLTPEELDERHFINTDTRLQTPIKFSPFARQGPLYRNAPPTPQKQQNNGDGELQQPKSKFRVISYDQSQLENVSLSKKLQQIQFPKTIPNSPYSMKAAHPATPLTMLMELQNWLRSNLQRVQILENQGISKISFDFIQQQSVSNKEGGGLDCEAIVQNVKSTIEQCLKQVLDVILKREGRRGDYQKSFESLMALYGKESRTLTLSILDELLLREQQKSLKIDFSNLLKKEIFLKSVFACAIETIFFIKNVKQLQIEDILKEINLKAFDFWRILNSFLKFDPLMPRVLSNHFREIEVNIVSEIAWQKDSAVNEMIKKIMKQQQSSSQTQSNDTLMIEEQKIEQILQPYNMFFKRVLHLSAQRIYDLCEQLNIKEEVKEKIWSIMKICLSAEPQLLTDRHLDQLIMCTIYGVCKAAQVAPSITFNNIITKYTDIFKHIKNIHNIYVAVMINAESGERKDIINFYNDVYIKVMKEYIISSKSYVADGSKTPGPVMGGSQIMTPSHSKPIIEALCPQSPLVQNLPPCSIGYNPIFYSNSRSNHGTPNLMKPLISPLISGIQMTPRTQFLYAYGETASSNLERLPQLWANKTSNGEQRNEGQIINFHKGGNNLPAVPSQFPRDMKSQLVQNIGNMSQGNGNKSEPLVLKKGEPTLIPARRPLPQDQQMRDNSSNTRQNEDPPQIFLNSKPFGNQEEKNGKEGGNDK